MHAMQYIPDRHAFSLGGKLNALTDPFLDHFRLGATLYIAQHMAYCITKWKVYSIQLV
jgi:hypothetical protein